MHCILFEKIKNFFVKRENFKQIFFNILWQFFDKITRLAIGVYISIWLARYFGPSQYGQYSYALAFVGIFSGLATFGLGGIVIRSLVNREHEPGTILGTAYFLHLLGSILCISIIYICSIYQAADKLTQELIYILSFGLVFQTSVVIKYWYESILKIRYLVLIENIIFILFCFIRIILINKNFTAPYFILLIVFENLCIFILFGMLYFYKNKVSNWNIKIAVAKKMLADSWPIMVSGFAVLLYMKIDQIMLGEMAGNKAVGIYSVAIKISELWYTIPVILASSFLPSTILKKNNGVDYLDGLGKLMSILSTLSIILSLFIYFFADQLVQLIFGIQYKDAAPVLSIHIWASIFVFLGVAGSNWYLIENQQRLAMVWTLIGAALNIALNLLLIPYYGTVGAAYATLIAYAFSAYLIDSFSRRSRALFLIKTRALFMGPYDVFKLIRGK